MKLMPSEPAVAVIARLLEDQPGFHRGGAVNWYCLPETLEAIAAVVRPGYSTLETGCGASTVVFAASGARHTVISPDHEEHELVRSYCETIGVETAQVRFVAGFSDDVLPAMGRARTLDAAFVDGAHSFPFPEVDWHYVTRMMKIGGHLLLDDVPIPAVAPLFRHMSLESNWREVAVLDERAVMFQMMDAPAPEDWVLQGFNRSYPLVGHLPPSRRLYVRLSHSLQRGRREIGERYPSLRAAWQATVPRSSRR